MHKNITAVGIALALVARCHDGSAAEVGANHAQGQPELGPSFQRIDIRPMTSVDTSTGKGYFQDPYPIHTNVSEARPGLPVFAGTTQQLLSCAGEIHATCFKGERVTLEPGQFGGQVTDAGASINNFENLNIFQDGAGTWHMAVTAHLKRGNGAGWNVILHAHPITTSRDVPVAWEVDTLLVGDVNRPAPDNYDGKYFEDDGNLYLLYNKKVGEGQDAVVAQVMATATRKAASRPVTLLGPETTDGGYNSELAFGLDQPNTVKLIETGNVTKINGKYAMTYSVGTFNRPDYKPGIAWSDTFLPAPGTYYRRVQKMDTAGVWGRANHPEVKYLLQAQKPAWPNYVARQVLAPGVPAIIQDANGEYYLTFAGYDPSDAPVNDDGLYKGARRRPYYVKLKVRVPPRAMVAGAGMEELSGWVVVGEGP